MNFKAENSTRDSSSNPLRIATLYGISSECFLPALVVVSLEVARFVKWLWPEKETLTPLSPISDFW